MTQPTHTKWSAGGGMVGVYCVDTGNRIADCMPEGGTPNRSEARANAVLMAAAPDLLAALKALETRGHTVATWQAANAAIAKAEQY